MKFKSKKHTYNTHQTIESRMSDEKTYELFNFICDEDNHFIDIRHMKDYDNFTGDDIPKDKNERALKTIECYIDRLKNNKKIKIVTYCLNADFGLGIFEEFTRIKKQVLNKNYVDALHKLVNFSVRYSVTYEPIYHGIIELLNKEEY